MEAIPYDQICRLCILNCNSVDLFTKPNSETPSYSELVAILSNEIDIMETDEFPNSICDECALKLIEYYKFKLLIEKSNNELKSLLKVDSIESNEFAEYEIDNFTNGSELDSSTIETKYEISATLNEEIYRSPQNFIYDDASDKNIELLEDDAIDHEVEALVQSSEEGKFARLEATDLETVYQNDEYLKEKMFITNEDNDRLVLVKNEYEIIDDSNDNIDFNIIPSSSDQLSPIEQNEWHKKLGAWIKRQSIIAKKSKRYKCDICGKDYGSKFAMNNHTYVHTGELNFECSECGRKFGQKKLLQAHMEVKHIKSKFFYCDTCGKCFNRKNNLLKHQWVHLDTGRFSCDYCGRIFKWKTSLNVHLTSHTGLKEYNCYICGKNYTSDASRRKHCKQVHDGKGIKPMVAGLQCEDLITEQTDLLDY